MQAIICCFSFHILQTFHSSLHLTFGLLQVPQTPLVKITDITYSCQTQWFPPRPHLTGLSAAVDRAGITLLPESLSLASTYTTLPGFSLTPGLLLLTLLCWHLLLLELQHVGRNIPGSDLGPSLSLPHLLLLPIWSVQQYVPAHSFSYHLPNILLVTKCSQIYFSHPVL